MLIEGIYKVTRVEDENSTGYELQLEFTEEFRGLSPAQQGERVRDYISRLRQALAGGVEDSREQQGMSMLLQVTEQLGPYLAAGEVPLEEPLVVNVAPERAIPIPLSS